MLANWNGLERSFSSLVVFICTRGTRKSAKTKGNVQPFPEAETHPDSFHHEADVADVLELGPLIDGINGLDVTGDLKQ